jgi:hypothetical protein
LEGAVTVAEQNADATGRAVGIEALIGHDQIRLAISIYVLDDHRRRILGATGAVSCSSLICAITIAEQYTHHTHERHTIVPTQIRHD